MFENLPVSEAVLFTGAFTLMGLIFGLAFLCLYGEVWSRRWTAAGCIGVAVVATTGITSLSTLRGGIAARQRVQRLGRAVGRDVGAAFSAHGNAAARWPRVADWRNDFGARRRGLDRLNRNLRPTSRHDDVERETLGAACRTPATLLRNGDLLVTGGINEHGALRSAELYRVATGDFVPVGVILSRASGMRRPCLTTGACW